MTRAVVLFALVLVTACRTAAGVPQPYVASVGAMAGAPVDEIEVAVTGLRSDAGTVRCFLFDDGAGFPDTGTHVVAKAVALPAARAATCRFVGVAHDRGYAIVVLHDENNDAVFQKGAFGMPLEGYGFSNDARARFSAPSFEAAEVRYASGPAALTIAMQY